MTFAPGQTVRVAERMHDGSSPHAGLPEGGSAGSSGCTARSRTRRRGRTAPTASRGSGPLPRRVRAARPLARYARPHDRLYADVFEHWLEAIMSDHDHDHDHAPITDGGEPPSRASPGARGAARREGSDRARGRARRRIDWLVSRSPADGARSSHGPGSIRSSRVGCSRTRGLQRSSGPRSRPVAGGRRAREHRDVHHVVVCTLCSCYPRALLGPPPDWYKSLPYRSRAVSDPRRRAPGVRLRLGATVEVRVVDSTADIRYLVVPAAPRAPRA